LAVVSENERYVCATVLEDGQMRVRMADDWRLELASEETELGFRVLVPPGQMEDAEEKDYFVWEATWTPFDQNFWLTYFQKAVQSGIELPDLLLRDFEFLTRCLQGKRAKDWSLVPIKNNPKFAKLYSVLLGFKALSELRQNKLSGLQETGLTEREGVEGDPRPGKALSTAF
jgi:hypothetical protein